MEGGRPLLPAGPETAAKEKRKCARIMRTRVWIVLVVMAVYSATPLGARFWRQLMAGSGFTVGAGDGSSAFLEVHVIGVGKADAILLGSGGRWALLDAGTILDGQDVVDYLARRGVEGLDYVIASHPDSDHIGGIAAVLEEIPTRAFVRGEGWEDAGQEAGGLLSFVEARAIPSYTLHAGDSIDLGHASLSVLGPLSLYPESNNNSLVFRLTCFQFSALFCGDIEKEAERDLLESGQDLSANLLKVAHHGSRTSTTEEFAQAVSPQLAVVSVGPDNNNLPRSGPLSRLEGAGARILRTDLDGNILISYNGERIGVRTKA